MRIALVSLIALMIGAALGVAQADPYRWCAVYGPDDGGSSNCYFMTLEQCQWTVSGIGGYCTPNSFYTGGASTAPDSRRRKRVRH